MLETAIQVARDAGAVLRKWFVDRPALKVRAKGDISNIVTEADLASEARMIRSLREAFPGHAILAEETGYMPGSAPGMTWVIDPLDGTSNFAAGLPWFGVLLAGLRENEPVIAVLYLPATDELYHATRGGGAYCNGRPVRVSDVRASADALWACAMDAPRDARDARRKAAAMGALIGRVRGVRTTNSLVDAALTADGRLGGWVNFDTRIWDIAAPWLLIREAGGRCTDPTGAALTFDPSAGGAIRSYEILAGAPAQHEEIVRALRT